MKFTKYGAPKCFSIDIMRNTSLLKGSVHSFNKERLSECFSRKKTNGKYLALFLDQIVKRYFHFFWHFLESCLLGFQ